MGKEPVRVLVTGGRIRNTLLSMIAKGFMLGPHQPIILRILDIPPAAEALNDVKMKLVDAAFPLLKGVVATTDAVKACTGVNVAVMLGGFAGKGGMETNDVMSTNVSIYVSQALALGKHAAANCKVLVVANPANTNALILKELAPSIPERNITFMTRLAHNRALFQISEKLNVPVSDVKNVIIWGYDSTLYPDINHATVKTPAGEKPVRELVANDQWLNGVFIDSVHLRGVASTVARSACDHIRNWMLGTPKGTWVSMGVFSDGSYEVPAGVMYSFPVTCRNGEWTIVQGLKDDEFPSIRDLRDDVKETQKRMVELNHLVARQSEHIDLLCKRASETAENVEKGKKELSKAIQRNNNSREFVLLSLVILIFSILFLGKNVD